MASSGWMWPAVVEVAKVLVPFFAALGGGYIALLGIVKKASMDLRLERVRKTAELMIEIHRERLAVVAEVAALVIQANFTARRAFQMHGIERRSSSDPLGRLPREDETDVKKALVAEGVRRYYAALGEMRDFVLRAQIASERYGALPAIREATCLPSAVAAWQERVLEMLTRDQVDERALDDCTAGLVQLCRQLGQEERVAMIGQADLLGVTDLRRGVLR